MQILKNFTKSEKCILRNIQKKFHSFWKCLSLSIYISPSKNACLYLFLTNTEQNQTVLHLEINWTMHFIEVAHNYKILVCSSYSGADLLQVLCIMSNLAENT